MTPNWKMVANPKLKGEMKRQQEFYSLVSAPFLSKRGSRHWGEKLIKTRYLQKKDVSNMYESFFFLLFMRRDFSFSKKLKKEKKIASGMKGNSRRSLLLNRKPTLQSKQVITFVILKDKMKI